MRSIRQFKSRFKRWLRSKLDPRGYHYEYRYVKMRHFHDFSNPEGGSYWYQLAYVKVPNTDLSCGWIKTSHKN